MEIINIGSLANDGTGDDLREAFLKVNNNFTTVQDQFNSSEVMTGANIGSSGQGVFSNVVGHEMRFKKIAGSAQINVTTNGDVIVVSANLANITLDDVESITASGTITSVDGFVGNLVGRNGPATVDGINIQSFYNQFIDFDFGTLSPIPIIRTLFDYMKYLYRGVDSQTATTADPLAIIDMGSFVTQTEPSMSGPDTIVEEPALFHLEFGTIV
jgi:hypothetical protein